MEKSSGHLSQNLTRRELLKELILLGTLTNIKHIKLSGENISKINKQIPICIFSKHLQWLDYNGMAETAAELGFDGIALTVRPGGHVLPEKVEEDLPRAFDAVKKAGIKIPLMITSISDSQDPSTEKILKTASKLGITHYRLGYYNFNDNTDILKQLGEFKLKLKDIEAINKEYKIFGGYENSNGNAFGSSIWDEWYVINDIKSNWIGYHFNITHSVQEGGGGSWMTDVKLIIDRIGIITLNTQAEWSSSVEWKNSNERKQKIQWNFPSLFELNWIFNLLKNSNFSGPISVNYEYPLGGGVDQGAKILKGITREELLLIMKQNLEILKGILKEANII